MNASMVLKLLAIDSKLNVIRFYVCSYQQAIVVVAMRTLKLFIITLSTNNNIPLIGKLQRGLLHWFNEGICVYSGIIFDFKRESQMGCLSSTPNKEQQGCQQTEKPMDKLRETVLTNTSHKQEFIFTPLQANYSILKQALDSNSNLKLIQQNLTKEQFILKYLKGEAKYIKTVAPMVNEYSKLRFAYLAPLLQHQVYTKEGQVLLRAPYYPHLLEAFKNDKFHKCDKLIVFYRIVRAVSYLQKNGIVHNKIQLDNIFFKNQDNRCIFLGLPNWTSPKKKEKQIGRIIHIKSLSKIFKALFPQPQLDESINKFKQQMDDVAQNQLTLSTILQRVLSFNFLDSIETVEQNKKTIIDYEQGDHYEGEVDQDKNKQGYGTMTQSQTKYWGHWTNNLRSNRGNFQCTEHVYVGQWKENKREGFGLIIQTKVREYYEGHFTNGQKDKFGIWEGTNGQIYVGNWNMNQREGNGIYYDGNGQFYYEGEWKDDKKNGKGKQVYRNGQSYEGEYKDNTKDGRGHYIHPNLFDYEGEFKENLITGHGTFIDKDKNTFVGTLINGVYQGRGKISNKDGSYFYEGEWKNGARHGEGQQKTKESHYIGGFVNNRKHGKGVLKELNQTYTGQFKMGRVTGFGEYLYENGDQYIGNFIDKLKDGKGVYTSAKDGSVYDGFWLQDKKHGKGKHTLKNGEYYDGEWFQSQRSGYGVQYSNEQNRYQGYWKRDRKQGKGIQYQSGNRYEGEFRNGMKHSKFATLVFKNGDVYEGSFVENRQQGEGTYTWSNGDQYVGGFVANNREGQGTMRFKQTEMSYEGGWKNDLREGHGIEKYQDGDFVGEFANNKKNGKGVRTFIDSDGVGRLVGTWVNDLKHGEFEFFFPDNTIERREYSNNIDRITLCMTAVPY